MIEGSVEVEIGGKKFWAAPLNFKALKEYGPPLDKLRESGDVTLADLSLFQAIVASSLRRNHPDISQDFLDDALDTRNVTPIMTAVMTAANVSKTATPPGEQKPVDEAGQSTTGTKSTST